MAKRTPEQLVAEILETVERIGALAKVEVSLYRAINGRYQVITERTTPDYLRPGSHGGSGFGYFAIAPKGQANAIELNGVVTSFNIVMFPGCCALCISTGASVAVNYGRRGINKLGLKLRQAIAIYTGYTGLVCTDVTHNIASIRTLTGQGFKELHTLRNRRTQNMVGLYIKDLEA